MAKFSDLERLAMRRALLLAEKGLYTTGENPRVGACLVKDGNLIAQGFHRAPGRPHAEIEVIKQTDAGLVRESTCVVTLEPCSHVGKTGPCAEALIDAGIARVVIAMEDPNPLVAGRGLARLRDANIDVAVGLYSEEARSLNRGFIKRMMCGRPYVWLKSAATLDGKVAMPDGESKWITGSDARRDVQRIRARCQAIVTGINTVLADDPQLTVRHNESGLVIPEGLSAEQPLRVILDTQGRLPTSNRLLDAEGPILWVTGSHYQHSMCANGRIEQWVAPLCDGRIDLKALLLELGRRQINEVLFEAGATLLGSLIEGRLVDQGVLYYAPKLLGQTARSLYDIAPTQLADAPEISIQRIYEVGGDFRLDWTLGTRA